MKRLTEEQKAAILKLKENGRKPLEISTRLKIPINTVNYHFYPSVREYLRKYKRDYQRRSEVREYQRKYKREHYRRRKYVIDVFTDFETGHTFEDILRECGGRPKETRGILDSYTRIGVLTETIEKEEKVYKLNPESPLHKVAGVFYEKELKKLEESIRKESEKFEKLEKSLY